MKLAKIRRKSFLVICILPLLVIAVVACSQTQIPESQPDIPRYTTDQVIVIAQAQYGCYSRLGGERRDTSAKVSVSYQGGPRRVWIVKISCPTGYILDDFSGFSKTLHFYEDTGVLGK